MLTPDQYYVPDNGDGGIGEEEQVKTAWCQGCKASNYCYVR